MTKYNLLWSGALAGIQSTRWHWSMTKRIYAHNFQSKYIYTNSVSPLYWKKHTSAILVSYNSKDCQCTEVIGNGKAVHVSNRAHIYSFSTYCMPAISHSILVRSGTTKRQHIFRNLPEFLLLVLNFYWQETQAFLVFFSFNQLFYMML